MVTASRARVVHTGIALVVVAALVLQFVLVLDGASVLAEEEAPPLLTRLGRLVSYFTIQSNLLVAVTATQLALDPARDGRWWRPVRAAALVGITVTGLVHFTLLRPLLHLDGASWVADKLLHMVVPVIAIIGWLVAGPRPRAPWRDALLALVWPVAWLVWTLVVGAATGWYPYPFLDVGAKGAGSVSVTCLGVTVLFLALAGVLTRLDDRMPPAPVRGAAAAPTPTPTTAQ